MSKAWRINMTECRKNYVDVEMKRKSDGFKICGAAIYTPRRGSVNYDAMEMQANLERGDKCDILVGDFNFRPTFEAAVDIWDEAKVRSEKPASWAGWKNAAHIRDMDIKTWWPRRLTASALATAASWTACADWKSLKGYTIDYYIMTGSGIRASKYETGQVRELPTDHAPMMARIWRAETSTPTEPDKAPPSRGPCQRRRSG